MRERTRRLARIVRAQDASRLAAEARLAALGREAAEMRAAEYELVSMMSDATRFDAALITAAERRLVRIAAELRAIDEAMEAEREAAMSAHRSAAAVGRLSARTERVMADGLERRAIEEIVGDVCRDQPPASRDG